MRKGVNKDKPKGTAYNILKAMKKTKRFAEVKEAARRTDKKRINAEARKERMEKQAKIDLAKQQTLVGYKKGYILIEIDGKIEKRKPFFPKVTLTKENYKTHIGDIAIKLYGNHIRIREINGYKNIAGILAFEIEGTL
ncbi:MAG: hypothetical protein DSY38_01225 [Fusobacteria bacterium]|nr:MAG: hypothetical protein DSY38_01225 [Fusobacteriota bacterium]